jgi:predicted phage terminase large subunit-like protein
MAGPPKPSTPMSAEPSWTFQTKNFSLSRSDAASELLKRRGARSNLIAFTEYQNPKYAPAPHHRLVAAKLEAVERGEIDRLMLMLPPRHGKSELASKHFPPFSLGRNPARQFISVSATSELAADFGRDVRNIIKTPEYASLFNTSLAEDSQDRSKWHTSDGGIYYAIGIGGSVLGRGADTLLIDDPFATMEDAQSELQRKRVWDWYTGTAYNRLMPNGAVVIIGHRMHDADLQGRLLAQQAAGGDQWEVVSLPAISEDGAALWPEWYPVERLERIRRNTTPRFWSALYQQNPTPDDGDYFKRQWIIPVEHAPPRDQMRVYGGSDYAVTADGGDYTVHAVLGVDYDGNPWLLDLWRRQASSDEWIDAFCDLVIKWRPIGWAEEQGQIRAGVGPFLDRRTRERRAHVARDQFPTRGDKAVRAQSFRGLCATRGLRIPIHVQWRAEVESELLRFPAGVHDDIVDALGLVGQLLDKINAPTRPVVSLVKTSGYRPISGRVQPQSIKVL